MNANRIPLLNGCYIGRLKSLNMLENSFASLVQVYVQKHQLLFETMEVFTEEQKVLMQYGREARGYEKVPFHLMEKIYEKEILVQRMRDRIKQIQDESKEAQDTIAELMEKFEIEQFQFVDKGLPGTIKKVGDSILITP